MPWGRRNPRPSPVSGVERGLATLSLVWEGLWLLPDPSLWPTNQNSSAEAVLLGAVLITWIAIVVTAFGPLASRSRRVKAQLLNIGALFAAGLVLLNFSPAMPPDPAISWVDWLSGASLVNLACALTGLLLVTAVSVPVILAAIFAESILLRIDAAAVPTSGQRLSEVLYPLYALAMGAAAVGARRGLFAAARRSEGARAALDRAEEQAQALRVLQRRMREQQRLLHETVLNTLTAVPRGGLGTGVEGVLRLRSRCAESALVLRTLAAENFAIPVMVTRDWAADVRVGTQPLIEAGVSVRVDEQIGGLRLPDDAYGAFVMAIREALSNVGRHAQAEEVAVSVSVSKDEKTRQHHWVVEVSDDGCGFDSVNESWRLGLRSSVVQTMKDVGGNARIESAVGSGTCVTLYWSTTPESRAATLLGESATIVNALGAPVLVTFGLFTLTSLLLTISEFEFPGVAITGFIIAVVCSTLLVWLGRVGTLPSRLVVGVCIASPLIYRLQLIGLGTGEASIWSDWSSEAIVAILLIVAGTGPWWGWVAALASWLLTQGDMLAELLRPGTAVIIAGALFARSVRANDRAYVAARTMRQREEASSAVDEVSLRALVRRYGPLRESSAVELLEGIAEGSIDPESSGVRADCSAEEHFIRTVMRIDPATSPLHAFASDLARGAHRRGIVLDVDIAEESTLRRGQLLALRPTVNRAMDHALAGEPARFSARLEGEEFIVRLVVRVAAVDPAAVVEGCGEVDLLWHADPTGSTLLLEARYA